MQRGRFYTTRSQSFWTSRPFEWGVLSLIIAVLASVFVIQYRDLEAQLEYSGIQSTLGTMRTALLMDFLVRAANGSARSTNQDKTNPFSLMQSPPDNYAGEVSMGELADVEPGNWLFDPACACVGYRPLHPQWLQPNKEPAALWFRLTATGGPPQLTPMHRYRWRGLPVN